MKKVLAFLLLFSFFGVNFSFAQKYIFDEDNEIISEELNILDFSEIKDPNILKLIKKNLPALLNITLSDFDYKFEDYIIEDKFFTKTLFTSYADIPKDIKKRLKNTRLKIITQTTDSNISQKIINFDYKPSQKYIFKTTDLIDEKILENERFYNTDVVLELVFDTGDILKIGGIYIAIPSKEDFLGSFIDDRFYYYLNYDAIKMYLNEKLKNLDTKTRKLKLENLKKGLNIFELKLEKEIKQKIKNIKKEEDFILYKDDYQKYSDTILVLRILEEIIEKILNDMKTFKIIDSL